MTSDDVGPPRRGAAVDAALDRALCGRTTRVAVCGAEGTGRTHLIEHARRAAARRSMRVLATHGRRRDAGVPYASMLTLLHPVADRLPELPRVERESLSAAVELRHGDVDGRAVRTGLWRLLTLLSDESPLLVTADDSDLMDLASLDVLAFALGRMDSHPVALLASATSHRSSNPLAAIGDELIVLDASRTPEHRLRAADGPEALASLTAAERRVAVAISRGMTNRQAAAELFVSVKTIDSHLQRIYPKLHVRSRGELAALVNTAA